VTITLDGSGADISPFIDDDAERHAPPDGAKTIAP
jgi:hypothetical protein